MQFGPSHPLAWNLLNKDERTPTDIVSAFHKLYEDSWGPRLQLIMVNTIKALCAAKGTTLLDATRMYRERNFRQHILSQVDDVQCLGFWEHDFPALKSMREDPFNAVTNKLDPILSNPFIRKVMGQKQPLPLRQIMDTRRIFLCNLSRGELGQEASKFLGTMLMTQMQNEAMKRASVSERERVLHYVACDEFQNFVTPAVAEMLSEIRKYRIGLVLVNQFLSQLVRENDTRVRDGGVVECGLSVHLSGWYTRFRTDRPTPATRRDRCAQSSKVPRLLWRHRRQNVCVEDCV